ncbi:AAA family ATPase [Actinoplanes sp. NPDC049316]|uniref:bifunctional aminoglycoside phosphotransferase/ATP-binding protein n=1 Tax=Actinoplanes sp. NPDC049316 TaxID=3154727 RepID=UPI003439D254
MTASGPAAVAETHAAVLFFVGDRAYKLKKPVDLGFLDFRDRADREAVCHREVALNRRLAPDVYLGVADVRGPGGVICDHLVVMRRMPAQRRLSTLIRSGQDVRAELRRLARVLAAFHATARRGPEVSAEGTRDALLGRWDATFAQLRPFHGGVLDADAAAEVERRTHDFLAGREPLFAGRIAGGHVVDGHADLIADDIFCLPDGPRILDCLEFDDKLRYVDVLDDVAFLAMDVEHLGAAAEARAFLDTYAEFSGDPAPAALLHHYVAYRAFVRAKVGCVRHEQGDPAAAADVTAYTELTLSHLRAGAVRLILTGGTPGTGKTTLAGALADRLGAVLISSDPLRKELAGLPPQTRAAAAYEQGIYSPAWTEKVYATMLRRTESLLAMGESVVLDASWNRDAHRAAARLLAGTARAGLTELRCTAAPATVSARLARRTPGASDADAAIAAALAADGDAWPEACPIRTDGPEPALDAAIGAIRGGGGRLCPPARAVGLWGR